MQRKKHTIHLVAPSEYQALKEAIEQTNTDLEGNQISLKVTNWDFSFNSLTYWAESKEKIEPDILLIFDTADYTRVDIKTNKDLGYKNIIDSLKKIKFNVKDETKIIIILSKDKEQNHNFINELIKLELYNIYFVEQNFTMEDLISWLFQKNKTLRDYKNYIYAENIKDTHKEIVTKKQNYNLQQRKNLEDINNSEKKRIKPLDTIKTLTKDIFNKTDKKLSKEYTEEYKVIKKTQTMIQQEVLGTIIIGVGNISKGSGCTHLSLAIANYLVNKNFKTALIEMNSNPCFKYIVNDKNAILNNDKPFIEYKNIDIYYQDGIKDYNIQNLFKNINISEYKYIVVDLGLLKRINKNDSMQPIENYYEMWRTNYQVLCLSGSPWKWGAINYYRHDDFAEVEPNIENWNLVVNFTNKTNFLKIKKEIKNITMLNKVYNMPMFSDVFSKNENVTTFLDNLLKDIIPISQPTKTLLNINPFKLLNNNE